jgi:hypothetical protein
MPRFLTTHTMACMTRQGAQQFAASLPGEGAIHFVRLLINMTEGKLIGEFEAPDRNSFTNWMDDRKIHYDSVMRVDIEATPQGVRDF